ncbi:hypothetical protein PZA11_006918 [Diplocarpon coronariae]
MSRLAARASASRAEASSPPKSRQSQRPAGQRTRASRSRSHSVDPGEGQAAMSKQQTGKRKVRQSSVDSVETAVGTSSSTRGTRSRKATQAALPTRGPDLSIVVEDSGELDQLNENKEEKEAQIENMENTSQHQSPRGISQMSGRTATTSFSHGEMEKMDPVMMADSLPDLFESSMNILDLLAPSAEADEEQVGVVIKELRIPGSHYALNLKSCEGKLLEVKGKYGDQTFIQTSHVLRKLLGSENAGDGDFRPDPVFHAANLAAFVMGVLVMQKESQGTHIALRSLCQNFPGAFMNIAEGDLEAQSKTMDLAFDLALKLHIQHAIAYLRGMHEKGYHLTPDQALADLFYEDIPDELDLHASYKMITQDSTMKKIAGEWWPLTQKQVAQVEEGLDNLAMGFRAEKYSPGADDLVDFEHIDGTFSWNSFVTEVVQWGRLRFNEVIQMVENQGGIDNVSRSLAELIKSNDSQGFTQLQPPLSISQQRGLLPAPEIRQSNASLYGGPGTVAFFESLKRQPGNIPSSRPQTRSRQASSAPVPVLVNAKKGPKSMQGAANSFEPTMDDMNEDHVNDHPRPTAEYTAAWDQNSKEKNKENHRPIAKPVPKRRLIDPQPNAERISNDWDISQEDVAGPSAPKRTHARAEREETEESEDQGFQEDQRLPDPTRRIAAPPARCFSHVVDEPSPPKKPRVNRRAVSPPIESGGVVARRQETEGAVRARREVQDDDEDDDVPPPTATELSAAARSAVARSVGPRAYRGRIPWSDDDSARLEEGIEEHGCSWALIHNSRSWDVDRGQVALKDRARNLKVQYLKNRMVLPRGFDKVALGKKEKDQAGEWAKGEKQRVHEEIVQGQIKQKPAARWHNKRIILTAIIVCLLMWHRVIFARPVTRTLEVAGVPQYVLDYAPLVWLDDGEAYFPSDILAQVQNTHPDINLTMIRNLPPLTLENLNILNAYGNHGRNVYLTSNINVTDEPKWLTGIVPNSKGRTHNVTSSVIIVNDRGNGCVDAFYMYFYAYNQGNTVLFQEFGDHIGDWEHNMIRFKNQKPQTMWFSQHENGQAFTYQTVEKMDKSIRPISYSAKGSHANYAVPGVHDHLIPDLNLPAGFLQDHTSKGLLWDPTLSAYFYNFNGSSSTFESINGSPVGAMYYRGQWGDQQYPDKDPKQSPPFFGFRKFVSGPTGPWDKELNRTNTCPDNGILCIIRDRLGP